MAPARPTFDGQPLLGVPFSTVREALRQRDPRVTVESDGLTSEALGIGLYAPSSVELPDEPAEGVIVFVRDTTPRAWMSDPTAGAGGRRTVDDDSVACDSDRIRTGTPPVTDTHGVTEIAPTHGERGPDRCATATPAMRFAAVTVSRHSGRAGAISTAGTGEPHAAAPGFATSTRIRGRTDADFAGAPSR